VADEIKIRLLAEGVARDQVVDLLREYRAWGPDGFPTVPNMGQV
jgi:hypothetical protein